MKGRPINKGQKSILREYKLRNLFRVTLLYLCFSTAICAHTLLYQTSNKMDATAVYLDEETRKVVVKKYSWSKDFLAKNGNSVKVKFPKTVKSLSSSYSPFFDNYDGVSSSQSYVDLDASSKTIKSNLSKLVNDSSSKFNVNETMGKLSNELYKKSKFKVIKDRTWGKTRKMALFNENNGKLIFHEANRRKVTLPESMVHPEDLKKYFNGNKIKHFDLSTPGKISNYLSSIKSKMGRFGFSDQEEKNLLNQINELNKKHKKKISNMNLVKSVGKKGDEKRLYMDLDTGKFYYQEMDDNEIDEDSFFSMNDDQSFERLRDLLIKEEMYSEEEFDSSYSEVFINHCKETKRNEVLENTSNITDILKVNTALWEDYLSKAVSNQPVVLDDGSLMTKVSYKGINHSVRIEVDDFGKIKKMSFLDPEKAKTAGLAIRSVKEGSEEAFKISALEDGELIDAFFFDMENINLKESPRRSNLAIYVKGAHETDQLGNYYYDKNIFPLEFNNSGITNSKKRIQLSADREYQYPREIAKGDGTGFTTFFFKNFFTTSSRRNKLVKEITKEAKNTSEKMNKNGEVLLNNDEIHQAVLQIVQDVESDIPKIKGSVGKVTATVYEHAYSRFSEIVVPKMIRSLIPGESEEVYKKMTKAAMVDFKKCLELASRASNPKGATKCMSAFEKEAPVVIGREILSHQLEVNDYGILKEASAEEYDKCIKENYDTGSENLDYIKGCIYKATFKTVDDGLNDVISLTLDKMSKEMDPSGEKKLTVKSSSLVTSQKKLRQCYESKGYMKRRVFSDNYDMEKLKKLEVDKFKKDLFTCASEVEQVVAVDVTGQFIDDTLSEIELSQNQKKELREDILENGMKYCIDAQKKKVAILEKAGKHSVVSASSCKSYVTLYATQKVVEQSLRDKAGDEVWKDIKEDLPRACFEKAKRQSLKETLEKSNVKIDVEKTSSKCLKESVEWISYHLAKSELSKIFASDKMYRKVKLSESKKDLYAKKLQSCFKEKLKDYNSVTEITSGLGKMQDSCTVSLVMSEEAKSDILRPVVAGMLEDNDVSKELADKTVDNIVSSMRERASNRLKTEDLTLNELVDEFKGIKGQAVYYVADATIDGYVKDFVSDPKKSSEISLKLRKDLFDGNNGYRNQLISQKDEAKLDSIVQNMTKDAAIKLTGIVTTEEAQKLYEKGTLKSREEVEKLSKSAPKIMRNCLDNFNGKDFSSHVKFCIEETKAQATKEVFEDQVSKILYDSEYSAHFSETEKEAILKKHISPELKDEIKAAYKEDNLEGFIEEFTLKTTISASAPVLRNTLKQTVYGKGIPESQVKPSKIKLVEEVTSKSEEQLESCLRQNLKEGKTKSIDTDRCINDIRLYATGEILGDILNNVAKYLESNKSGRDLIVNKSKELISKCTLKEGNKLKGADFSNKLNSCLIEGIFSYAGDLFTYTSNNSDYIMSIKDEDLEAYRKCVLSKKKSLITNSDLKNKNVILSKINSKEEFFEKFYVENEKLSKDKNIDIINWSIETVKACAVSKGIPELVKKLVVTNKTRKELDLDPREYAFTLSVVQELQEFVDKEFEDRVWLDFKSRGTGSDQVKAPVVDTNPKDLNHHLEKIIPLVGEYVKKLHGLDSKKALSDLKELLKTISKAKDKKDLNLDDLKEILINSELMNTVIMSEVSGVIKKEAKSALLAEGLTSADIDAIVSPRIIKSLFSSKDPNARKLLEDIKVQYIEPLLNGKKATLPKQIVKDVKLHLTKDTKMGGFVETLAGRIVQKKLDDKRPGNFATQGIAGLAGYHYTDFEWSHLRSRRQPGVANKDQPVQKTIEYFGAKILKPILLEEDLGMHVESGIFSTTKTPVIDKRKEEFEEKIKELIDLD